MKPEILRRAQFLDDRCFLFILLNKFTMTVAQGVLKTNQSEKTPLEIDETITVNNTHTLSSQESYPLSLKLT